MNLTINTDPNRLVIAQRLGLGHKLLSIGIILMIFGIIPGFALYQSGTIATLTCAQEVDASVVCTDRATWFGAFPRTVRYERVELAYAQQARRFVSKTSRPALHLETPAGVAVFAALHDAEYVNFVDQINAFVQAPSPTPLVLRDPVNILGVALTAPIMLGLTFICWRLLWSRGSIASFDTQQKQVEVQADGVWRRRIHRVPFDAIVNVYASGQSTVYVTLTTDCASFLLAQLTTANSPDPSSAADTIVHTIDDWLAQHQVRPQPAENAPAAADLVEVCHPMLAYLLGHSHSAAVVMRGDRAYLNMDRIGGSPRDQRGLRGILATLERESPQDRDHLARLIAPELLAACHVDVQAAYRAANLQQRAAIDELLRSSRQQRER
jgi:hypothetical protein